MLSILNSKGFLVTYCCQGQARRNMISAGFSVEKVPGPPGKREMLKATKL
jgi:tRNA U34 5-methylaminomethyl-2-thiouridine-forming methyltransferase MnmC